MFLFREYALCLLLPVMLAGMVVAVSGIGYMLKIVGTMGWKKFRAFNRTKVTCTGTPGVMAD